MSFVAFCSETINCCPTVLVNCVNLIFLLRMRFPICTTPCIHSTSFRWLAVQYYIHGWTRHFEPTIDLFWDWIKLSLIKTPVRFFWYSNIGWLKNIFSPGSCFYWSNQHAWPFLPLLLHVRYLNRSRKMCTLLEACNRVSLENSLIIPKTVVIWVSLELY